MKESSPIQLACRSVSPTNLEKCRFELVALHRNRAHHALKALTCQLLHNAFACSAHLVTIVHHILFTFVSLKALSNLPKARHSAVAANLASSTTRWVQPN